MVKGRRNSLTGHDAILPVLIFGITFYRHCKPISDYYLIHNNNNNIYFRSIQWNSEHFNIVQILNSAKAYRFYFYILIVVMIINVIYFDVGVWTFLVLNGSLFNVVMFFFSLLVLLVCILIKFFQIFFFLVLIDLLNFFPPHNKYL